MMLTHLPLLQAEQRLKVECLQECMQIGSKMDQESANGIPEVHSRLHGSLPSGHEPTTEVFQKCW